MVSNKTEYRIRYCDVDRMGYLHHGNYAAYFEAARTELLREHGLSYKEVEEKGVILPLRDLHIEFIRPVFYDEIITIETILEKAEGIRLLFKYIVTNQQGVKISEASTMLVFADAQTGKPIRGPRFFKDKLEKCQ